MSTATYLVGDVFARMAELPDASVDLVMTSPPFLALRSYLPADHPDKHLEIGSEATPADFLDTLLALTAEWGRLLTPHGSICVELGDTYAGSGGAGGDYKPGGWRAGQQGATGSMKHEREHKVDGWGPFRDDFKGGGPGGAGWPLDKSLTGIPTLYAWSLAYGRNLLTGQPSPAGQWRIRNVVAWVRPNPPVGALGDKFRPATSYLTVATRARDRWFDLDAVRTPHMRPENATPEGARTNTKRKHSGRLDGYGTQPGEPAMSNPAGAPPLDWWNHVDQLIDNEIAQRAGKTNGWSPGPKRTGKERSDRRGGNWSTFPEDGTPEARHLSVGAQGSHIRRRLEQAGYLGGPTDDVWDIAPSGYPGAHYAVYPPELCVRPILAMCPRRVCTTCGEPSRRITVDRSAFARQPDLAAHIKERREALGITSADINGWFGYKEIAKNWERTDRHGAAIPNPADWPVLKDRLGLSDDFDDLVLGERRWTESTAEYFDQHGQVTNKTDRVNGEFQGSGSAGKRDGGITAQRQTLGWSDCGCPGDDRWRPGHVLDPFAGTGTTLAVATGHGRTATGIDIDPRNAELALERLGMFLTIHDTAAEAS